MTWADTTFADVAALQAAVDDRRARYNTELPVHAADCHGQPPLVAHPQARHSGRPYSPALEEFCHSPSMQHLDQRIARRCRLHPLRREEVADYIQSRLSAAADEPVLHLDSHGDVCQLASLDDASGSMDFPAPALDAIATLSGGVPRVINLLCERSLDIAWRRGVSPVDAKMVRAAARQLDIPVPSQWFMSTRPRTA